MPLGKAIIIIIVIILLSSFSGCTLLRQTTFTLLSLTITDDTGFPYLSVSFNTSDESTLTVTDPYHTILFQETSYAGVHTDQIPLGRYRTTVPSGTYTIHVVDASKHTIFQNDMVFDGCSLSFTSIEEDWWTRAETSIVAFHLEIKNSGDLPAYPSEIAVVHGGTTIREYVIPTVVLPLQTEQIPCFLSLSNLSSADDELNISLYDTTGTLLARSTVRAHQEEPLGSWIYQWHHLGSQTLNLPAMSWFSDYYAGLERFNIVDYAAYVFDRYDDRFLEFLADRLLSDKNLKTDVEKINFIASFVQALDYEKDDPYNESYEYPRYPLETLRDRRGDCEDKAILTAALIVSLGYNVSLIRLPTHMAVGVHLNETLPLYSYYIDRYYFLETTTLFMPLGKIPSEYLGLTNVTVYPLSLRPLLLHNWKDATRYEISTGADYVTVTMVLENLGSLASSDVEIRGAFYDNESRVYNQKSTQVPIIAAGEKCIVQLSIDVPTSVSTTLKTQVVMDGTMVHQHESTSRFP
jgi:archaellum component FlaF (FlaF/FlaG flagellin family)